MKETYCGFVAVIGAPNAGKSTLVNQLVGSKVSIVSPKPQTTRSRVLGILVDEGVQLVFIDTPGIFTPNRRLDKAMVAAAWTGAQDADAILLVIDAARGKIDPKTRHILDTLLMRQKKVYVILNKTDVTDKGNLLALTNEVDKTGVAEKIFMVSALTGDGVKDVLTNLKSLMPKGPFHFPEDQLTDMPQRLLAAEIIREHLFRQLRQELPYELAVEPESWEEFDNGSAKIRAKVIVSRDKLKPIILGAGGQRIKAVREAAQRELEEILDRPVHLFLHLTVDEKWQEKRAFYQLWQLDYDGR